MIWAHAMCPYRKLYNCLLILCNLVVMFLILHSQFSITKNLCLVALAYLTSISITGTSTKTPTTVASVAPEFRPNKDIATATASSKKLLAPIIPAGAAIS